MRHAFAAKIMGLSFQVRLYFLVNLWRFVVCLFVRLSAINKSKKDNEGKRQGDKENVTLRKCNYFTIILAYVQCERKNTVTDTVSVMDSELLHAPLVNNSRFAVYSNEVSRKCGPHLQHDYFS